MIIKKEVEIQTKRLREAIAKEIDPIVGVAILEPAAFTVIQGGFAGHAMQIQTPRVEAPVERDGNWPDARTAKFLKGTACELVDALKNTMKKEGAIFAVVNEVQIYAYQKGGEYETYAWFDLMLPSTLHTVPPLESFGHLTETDVEMHS